MISRAQTSCRGMTLAEVMGALIIASMVLIAVLGIYGNLTRASNTVLDRLDTLQQPLEVVKLLTDDLDKIIATGSETSLKLYAPKYSAGYNLCRLEIRRSIMGAEGQETLFEEIIWQTAVDTDTQRLVLYRAHNGEIQEDRLFDPKRKENKSLYPFIPVYTGLSHFAIQVVQGENVQDQWLNTTLPPGLRIHLSFAEPELSPGGEFTIPEEDMVQRTVSVDALRVIKFQTVQNGGGDPNQLMDPNVPFNGQVGTEKPEKLPLEARPDAVQQRMPRR